MEHLKAGGVVTGDVDAMLENNLAGMFMPCGLGHFIGLDTHDVGGYLEGHPERITKMGPYGIKKLRTARILQESMCLTVEPGIYFVDDLMDLMLETPAQAAFLVKDRLASKSQIMTALLPLFQNGAKNRDLRCVLHTQRGANYVSNPAEFNHFLNPHFIYTCGSRPNSGVLAVCASKTSSP